MRSALKQSFHELTRGLPTTYWFLLFGMLLNRLGSFVLPLFAIYLTAQHGFTLSAVGITTALYGIGSVVGTFVGGTLADRFGRRRSMLLALLLGAGAMVLFGQLQTQRSIFVGAFFLGALGDLYRPAANAAMADLVPPERRMAAFTLQYWAINLGFALSALLGGFLAKNHFALLFIGDAVTTLLFAAVVFVKIPETRGQHHERPAWSDTFAPLKDRPFLVFIVLTSMVTVVFAQHLTTLPYAFTLKGLSAQDYGVAMSVNGFLIVLLQPFFGSWSARFSQTKMLSLASALTGVGFGLIAWANTLLPLSLTVVVWTVGEMIFAPVNATVVANMSPESMRGRYQGAFGATWAFSAVTAPLLGTLAMQHFGSQALWFACFLLGLSVATVHVYRGRRLVQPPLA